MRALILWKAEAAFSGNSADLLEAADDAGEDFHDGVNVGGGVVETEGEADRGMGNFGVAGFCHEDVRGLGVAGGAGGASRDDDAGSVEVELDRLAFGGVEGNVEDVGERFGGGEVGVQGGAGNFLENAVGEGVAESADLGVVDVPRLGGEDVLESDAEADDRRGVVGAATSSLFLKATEEEGAKGDAGADIEGADAERAADFVGAEGGVVEL